MSTAKPRIPARLVELHNFVRKHEGPSAAYEWLVATVSNQADTIATLRREVSVIKARLTRTRIRNETELNPTDARRSRYGRRP